MKSYYFAACLLLTVGIIMESIAKAQYSIAFRGLARAAAEAEADRENAGTEADRLVRIGNGFSLIGVLITILAVISWIRSKRDQKQRTQVVPVVLLAVYTLVWLLMV